MTLVGLTRGRTSSVVISRAAVAGSGLFTVLLTSRLLSPDARGVFAALQASVTIMGVCGCASLWLGISVLLPQLPAARGSALALAVIWPLLLSALLTIALVVFGPPAGITRGVAAAFVAVSLPAMAYSNLQGIPIGLNRMTIYARAEVLRASTALVLVGCGMAVVGWRSPAVLVLLWGCGSWTLATCYILAACGPYHPKRVAGFVRAAVSRSLRIHPNSVVWLAVQRLDIVVLAVLSSHAQVAYYSLGVAIAEGVWLVPGAIAITGLADYSRLDPPEALCGCPPQRQAGAHVVGGDGGRAARRGKRLDSAPAFACLSRRDRAVRDYDRRNDRCQRRASHQPVDGRHTQSAGI